MDGWGQQLEAERSHNEALRAEIEYAVTKALDDAGIKIHSFTSRVKSLDSFQEKIGRKSYTDPFSEMRDIVGGRVVCLFMNDLERVDAVIRENFEVSSYENKAQAAPPDTWRYVSVHYDCTLGPKFSGARYDWINDRVFEIQVRTILQDAWATVEHYLAYKGVNSVPDELRRDFSALAGLFHVADRSFEQLHNAALSTDIAAEQKLASIASNTPVDYQARAEQNLDIDRSTIKALLRQMFADRKPADPWVYSEFVEELTDVQVYSIGDLRMLIERGLEAALEHEEENPPVDNTTKETTRFKDVGIARQALDRVVPQFKDLRNQRLRARLGKRF